MTKPEAGEVSTAAHADVEQRGGLLGPYLSERYRYALLEQLLCSPARNDKGEGQERACFAGLSRSELQVYVRLAGAVETSGREVDQTEAPQELLREMLSGDRARIFDAINRLAGDSDAGDAPGRAAICQTLLTELDNTTRSATERAGAGYALGLLGDPRPGVGLKDGLPDIEWAPVEAGPFVMGDGREPVHLHLDP